MTDSSLQFDPDFSPSPASPTYIEILRNSLVMSGAMHMIPGSSRFQIGDQVIFTADTRMYYPHVFSKGDVHVVSDIQIMDTIRIKLNTPTDGLNDSVTVYTGSVRKISALELLARCAQEDDAPEDQSDEH